MIQAVNETVLSKAVCNVLGKLAAEMVRSSAADIMHLMRREELSMPRTVALMFLEREGAASISDISNYLNLALGTTSYLVDQLVCADYVTRSEDPNDRRLKSVMLTAKGRAFVEEVKETRVEDLAQRLVDVPSPVLASALRAMSELLDHLQVDRQTNQSQGSKVKNNEL
jgi:DNA-binding MarR family transcriptional regulator